MIMTLAMILCIQYYTLILDTLKTNYSFYFILRLFSKWISRQCILEYSFSWWTEWNFLPWKYTCE